jgi:hypothetical protein
MRRQSPQPTATPLTHCRNHFLGCGDAETKRKALENGAEALLTEPIDFVTLRNEIDNRVDAPHERTVLG